MPSPAWAGTANASGSVPRAATTLDHISEIAGQNTERLDALNYRLGEIRGRLLGYPPNDDASAAQYPASMAGGVLGRLGEINGATQAKLDVLEAIVSALETI